MEWELEYSDKAWVVEAAIERGLPLPSWATNEPEIYPIDQFYLAAFSELGTCRQFGFSAGPIPWDRIILFGEKAGLDNEMIPIFVRVIRAMDAAWLTWQGKKKPEDA